MSQIFTPVSNLRGQTPTQNLKILLLPTFSFSVEWVSSEIRAWNDTCLLSGVYPSNEGCKDEATCNVTEQICQDKCLEQMENFGNCTAVSVKVKKDENSFPKCVFRLCDPVMETDLPAKAYNSFFFKHLQATGIYKIFDHILIVCFFTRRMKVDTVISAFRQPLVENW